MILLAAHHLEICMPQIGRHHEQDWTRPSSPIGRCGFAIARNMRSFRIKSSLTCRRLPQLDLVALRIHHPAKLTELGVIRFFKHIAAFFAQRFK